MVEALHVCIGYYFYCAANNINGKVFSVMRPEHMTMLRLSLGGQILLEDILTGVSCFFLLFLLFRLVHNY